MKRSLNQHVREAVERRLQQALRSARDERPKAEPQHAAAGDNGEAKEIETTMEELQGFYNVRAVLREHVDLSRVVARDVQSYFGVLLDDNNRKPICRLHFNGGQRYLGVFDADKNEDRIAVTGPDDIFAHATRIADSLAHALHR